MDTLTDLDICKRIAEIEDQILYEDNLVMDYELCAKTGYDEYREYDPLTDDALCFQLAKKYNVNIMHHEECSTARIWDDPEDNPIADISTINNDTDLNKAILLCIIKSKENSNG